MNIEERADHEINLIENDSSLSDEEKKIAIDEVIEELKEYYYEKHLE